jgi:hypothetical protein
MKKRMTVLLLALLLILVLAVPASAGQHILAEGWWVFDFDPDDRTRTPRGGVCIVEFENATRTFHGTLVGVAEEDIKIIVQGPCEGAFPGKYEDRGHAEGTFVGRIGDRHGTFRYILNFRHHPTDPPTIGGTGTGKLIILNGTDELANLHGVLDSSWPPNPTQYIGRIHFAPQR